MNKWQDILKVQVLDTTTSLSSINEPMIEDKDCCEEAKEYFKNLWYKNHVSPQVYPYTKEETDITWDKTFNVMDCEDIKRGFQISGSKDANEALRFWEECENE